MPRRYSDYPDVYRVWNWVSSLGSLISLVSVLMFLVIVWEGFRRKRGVVSLERVGTSLE